MNSVIFPGSFDPFTLGHEDIVRRAADIFGKVVVAVGVNSEKRCMLPAAKRVEAIKRCFAGDMRVEVVSYEGLTVDLCRRTGIFLLLRGIRDTSDWEYEKRIAQINNVLDSRVETMFLHARPGFAAVNSSVVRDILNNGGDISGFVPECVAKIL